MFNSDTQLTRAGAAEELNVTVKFLEKMHRNGYFISKGKEFVGTRRQSVYTKKEVTALKDYADGRPITTEIVFEFSEQSGDSSSSQNVPNLPKNYSAENIVVDPEFQALIPPLNPAEFAQLEASILRDGIQDPLKVWQGVLIDGHNRLAIAQKHNLPFNVVEMNFNSGADVIKWIVQNQLARRNTNDFTRAVMALKLKPVIAAEAKKNQGTRTDLFSVAIAENKMDTREIVAKIARISPKQLSKVEFILKQCGDSSSLPNAKNLPKSIGEELLQKLERGEISINAAYNKLHDMEEEKSVTKNFSKQISRMNKTLAQFKDTDFPNNTELLRNAQVAMQKLLDALNTEDNYDTKFDNEGDKA